MSSVVCSVSFGTINHRKCFDPKSENLTILAWQIFFISDQKSKLTKFSINFPINQNILVVYPVCTDKMSPVNCSVSFGSIKVFDPESDNLTMSARQIFCALLTRFSWE